MNHTDQNNITWFTDATYIDIGQTGEIGDAAEQAGGFYLQSLRFFPKPLNKSCYQLPVAANTLYLLRLWFAVGNYSGFQQMPSFSFSIETLGMLHTENLTIIYRSPVNWEGVLVSSGTLLFICLIRTSETDDPFISAIELRTVRDGMYMGLVKPGTMMISQLRLDVGGNSTVRYPQDKYDRIWTSADYLLNAQNSYHARRVSSEEPILTNNTEDLPPMVVMQTAWVADIPDGFEVTLPSSRTTKLLVFYFAEIEILNKSESRSFYVTINGERRSENITLVRNYSAFELSIVSNKTDIGFQLLKAQNSIRGPILNGAELYLLVDTQRATYSEDIEALDAIKTQLDMKNWTSDPCYLIHWEGIVCDNSWSEVRISEINLSGRNLTVPVPEEIGHLTALVNLFFENNHLIGLLPNFSHLTLLERLYLQNNNLGGSVPNWLSELKNLKELFIQNNNFSGIIPAQLLSNRILKINYSGNPYLCMHKGECILPNSNNNKIRVVLGVTLSGILIMAAALIMGIVVYRKKFQQKEDGAAVEDDYPMIMVPSALKSRAFTLDELKVATQNFREKIIQGGFGSVFFGKLEKENILPLKSCHCSPKRELKSF